MYHKYKYIFRFQQLPRVSRLVHSHNTTKHGCGRHFETCYIHSIHYPKPDYEIEMCYASVNIPQFLIIWKQLISVPMWSVIDAFTFNVKSFATDISCSVKLPSVIISRAFKDDGENTSALTWHLWEVKVIISLQLCVSQNRMCPFLWPVTRTKFDFSFRCSFLSELNIKRFKYQSWLIHYVYF